jgi:HAMP domain-containing protein
MPDRWRGPPRRPPWWPENEPFPPPGGWGGGPRRFPRRVGIAFALFLGLTLLAAAALVRLLAGGSGQGTPRGAPVVPLPFLALGLLLAVLLVGRAVRRMAAPIGDVMEAADRVAGGDYRARVQARGPGEVRRLARSFNQMAARLEANEAQRRNLLADVAHELRTPLSVIRGNVEGVLDGLYPADEAHLGPVVEETAVMARLRSGRARRTPACAWTGTPPPASPSWTSTRCGSGRCWRTCCPTPSATPRAAGRSPWRSRRRARRSPSPSPTPAPASTPATCRTCSTAS